MFIEVMVKVLYVLQYLAYAQIDVHMYVYLLHMGAQRQVISHCDCERMLDALLMYIHSSVVTYACL